nr:hypothetical protein [Tanacetum cinerariifolium]
MKYQALKRKPLTEAQARKNMIIYLKNMAGYKMNYFKGMAYSEIRHIFKKHYNYNQAFLEEVNEEDTVPEKEVKVEGHKRKGGSLEKEITKKQMMDEEAEELKSHLQIVLNDDDDVYIEGTPLASKIPIIDYKIHLERNKPYFKIIRADGCSVCCCLVENTLLSAVIYTLAIGSSSYMGLMSASSACASFLGLLLVSRSADFVPLLAVDVKTVMPKHEPVDVKTKGVYSTVKTKTVRKNSFSPPIIEDWNSDDESEVEFEPKVEVKTIRPSIEKIKFVKTAREKEENVEKPKQHKHYPRGNQRNWNNLIGEDRLKLKELMKLSTKLSDRVLDLENIKTAQAKEIADLKKRVKKLERKRRSRTSQMNLFKIGTSRRRSLGKEDASKQGKNLKQRSIFKESDFDVQAMMDAD